MRVFYAAGSAANLIDSHENWAAGVHNTSEVSLTFSGQIQSFCREIGADALFVSMYPDGRQLRDGSFRIEHRPKRSGRKLGYHLGEIRYGLMLLYKALKFRADVALLDSGSTHYFVMGLFRLAGIAVIPILHNTLWPAHFPPRKLIPRVVRRLDGLFFRLVPSAAIAVSPECERQIGMLTRGRHKYPVFQIRAQFDRAFFAKIPPPPPHAIRPFTILFVGRVVRSKGVLDIPEMAAIVEAKHPGLVRWIVCGSGPDLDELVRLQKDHDVEHVLDIRGWTAPEELIRIYGSVHASIVPTRSLFAEGLAMTAAEAVLTGRPIVTNPVVPALEILRPAAVEARTDDVESHARAVEQLAADRELFDRLQAACGPLQEPFYDRGWGLAAILLRATSSIRVRPLHSPE